MRMRHCVKLVWAAATISAAAALSVDAAPPTLTAVPQDVADAVIRHMRDRVKHEPLADQLRNEVEQTDRLLAGIESEAAKGNALSNEMRMYIDGQAQRFASLRDAARQHVGELSSKSVHAEHRRHWDGMAARVHSRFQVLAGLLDAVAKAKSAQDAAKATSAARQWLARFALREDESAPFQPQQRVADPGTSVDEKPATSLPAFVATSQEMRGNMVAANGGFGPVLQPVPAEAAQCSYTASDLAATADVQLTQEIQELAKSLNYDPRQIYQYIYEQIKFEPYWGAMKGATGALWTKAGGPTDIASLTIALLRASNIPARYVRGTVYFAPSDDRGRRWLGAKTNQAAVWMAKFGNYPTRFVDTNNSNLIMSHVWIEACVPYGNYRGSRSDLSGHRWVPLDPSFKELTYQDGVAVSVDFDYAGYMAARTNELPYEHYAKQVEAAAKTQTGNNNTTLDDVPYRGTLSKRRWDVLPTSLPYSIAQYIQWGGGNTTAEASSLPAPHRYTVDVTVKQGATNLSSTYTAALSDIAFTRLTIGFKGATPGDETNLQSWRSGSATTPACAPTAINVVPAIKLGGVDQVVGTTAVSLCATNIDVALNVHMPEISTNQCTNPNPSDIINCTTRTINAADHAAVIAYAVQGSDRVFSDRYKALGAAIQANAGPLLTLDQIDAIEGEFLFTAGMRYAYYVSERGRYYAALSTFANEPGPHLGLTSSKSKVSYLFDEPLSVSLKGTLVDVVGIPSRLVKLDETSTLLATVNANSRNLFRFSLYDGSAHEHYIWQETARIDAVSTVRGLQWAAEQGAAYAVQQFDSTNVGSWDSIMDPALACYKPGTTSATNPSCPSTALVPTLAAGEFIRIPKKKIAYLADGNSQPWNGIIYELNLASGIAMAISGGFNGGFGALFSGSVPAAPIDLSVAASFINSTTTNNGAGVVQDAVAVGSSPAKNGIDPTVTTANDPVNILTGNLYHTERDIAIKGRGLPLVFERSYNSKQAKDGPLGFGWTHSFNHVLKFYGVESGVAKVSWTDGTGGERFYSTASHVSGNINVNVTLNAQAGVYAALSRLANGQYQIREKNGLTRTFESQTGPSSPPAYGSEPKARLVSITDRNGNTLTLAYSTACGNNLCTVTDGLSRALTFTYTNNRITQIADFTGRQFQYVYDTNGNLASFKTPLAVAGTQNPLSYTYYSDAQLNHAMQSYTLPRGNGMSFEYYMNGKVLRHTTTLGEVTTFFYNDFRLERSTVNERGFKRTFVFDTHGNLITLIEENGATRSYAYTDANNPYNRTSMTSPSGYVTNYTYDASGNVTQVINPSGSTVAMSNYNAFAQPGKTKDANNNYTILKYDLKGNTTDTIVLRQGVGAGIADPAAYVPNASDIVAWTRNTYDGTFGNLTQVKRIKDFTNQTGPTLTNNYDPSNLNVTSIRRCPVTGACDTSPTMLYDTLGRVKTGLTANWYLTTTDYDAVDRITRASDAMGNLRDFAYDANGNLSSQTLTQVVNGAGQLRDASSAAYDLSDRRTKAIDAAGSTSIFDYDPAGNVIRVTNPDGFFVAFDYDANNRAIRAYDEKGNAVSTVLDFEGRKRAVTDPNGATIAYDYYDATKDGRLKKITDPASRASTYDYDFNGNVTSVTDNLGNVTLSFYDELNRPVRIVGPAYTDRTPGSATFNTQIRPVTQNVYDTLGRLVQVNAGYTANLTGADGQDVPSNQMSYVFDDFGRKLQDKDGLNRAWVYQYDINNNVFQITDAKGQNTTLTYGYGSKLATITDQSGRKTSYIYNARGQVLTAQSPEVTYSYAYDAALRLASVNDSRGNKAIAYSYSPGGRLTRMTIDDAGPIDYRYDTTGKLASIWDSFDTQAEYIYDAVRLKQRVLSNGTSAEFIWNADGTLQQRKNSFNLAGVPSILTQHDYHYDPLGRRDQVTDKVGSFSQPSTAETFAYDALFNRTQRTATGVDQRFTFDASNQLTQIRDGLNANGLIGALVYDANGNVTKKCTGAGVTSTGSDCAGPSVLALTFDAMNRLSQALGPSGTETYGYDDQGRRIRKTVNGQNTFYLYNGQDIVAEYADGWAKPTAINLHGAGTDDPIARYTKNASGGYDKAYYHSDGLGSVMAQTKDDGTITATQMFDAWGNNITTSSIGAVPGYGYTGREPDGTGLIYYRARYYDGSIGRFVSKDPIGMAGGLNYYAYVNNNPLNLRDPLGLVAMDVLQIAQNEQATGTMTDVSSGLTAGRQSLDTGTNNAYPPPPNIVANGGNVAAVSSELAKLPSEVVATLVNAGVTWVAVKNSVVEALPSLSGVTPRGWPPGSSWDTVPGTFNQSTKSVIVATSGTYPTGSYNMTLHETGHAYDSVTGGSSSTAFMAAYNADKSKLGPYFTQSGAAGPQEAFSEGFARYYGTDPSYGSANPNLFNYWSSRKP